MIWYILGGFIGVIFFKKKYNLSFWQAISTGIVFAFGIYFSSAAVVVVLALIFGLEESSSLSWLSGLINFALAILCFRIISRLKKQKKSSVSVNKENDINSIDNFSIKVDKYIPEPGDTLTTNVVGVTYEGRQDILKTQNIGTPVRLIREPHNEYDSNAIKIVLENGLSIGYINKDLASKIAPIIDDSNYLNGVDGEISSIYQVKNEPSIVGARIRFHF